jgi:hypothetical protein
MVSTVVFHFKMEPAGAKYSIQVKYIRGTGNKNRCVVAKHPPLL